MEEKKKYLEGECESCNAYGQLYEIEGKMLCEQCRDEAGKISDKESKTEE
ncbi:MAG: hypothetical protein ABIB71_08955 [Candidatus Woesearchaeota archaeon]